LGVADSSVHIGWLPRWLLKHPLADKAVQESILLSDDARAAGCGALIVRPPRLLSVTGRGLAALAESTGALPTRQIARATPHAHPHRSATPSSRMYLLTSLGPC
jgi:hypothetical protein